MATKTVVTVAMNATELANAKKAIIGAVDAVYSGEEKWQILRDIAGDDTGRKDILRLQFIEAWLAKKVRVLAHDLSDDEKLRFTKLARSIFSRGMADPNATPKARGVKGATPVASADGKTPTDASKADSADVPHSFAIEQAAKDLSVRAKGINVALAQWMETARVPKAVQEALAGIAEQVVKMDEQSTALVAMFAK